MWDDLRARDYRLSKITHQGRLSILRHLANWMQSERDITDPGDVTRQHLQAYLNAQQDAREGGGVLNVYKALRIYFGTTQAPSEIAMNAWTGTSTARTPARPHRSMASAGRSPARTRASRSTP